MRYQSIFIELCRQSEIAKIDEIRDMPVINIQEWTGVPIKKTGPKRALIILVVSILSFIVTVFYILFFPKMKIYVNSLFLNQKYGSKKIL